EEKECVVAIGHRRELPSTGQMAGFRNWRVTPGKFSRARRAAAKRTEGRRNPPPRRGSAQGCGRLFGVKNRPRANSVRGLGGVTGNAEFSCDGCWMPGRDDLALGLRHPIVTV